MSVVNPNLKPKGVYHMRGGIERYVKTFPEGGFWKGKNYLFDRRMEQIPGTKDMEQVEQEVQTKCCLCRQKWTHYRGKFKCSQSLCGVPVIVCTACDATALRHPERLTCELCKEGYRAPESMPDLVTLKRKAESVISDPADSEAKDEETGKDTKKRKDMSKKIDPKRLFLSRLPLTVTKTKIHSLLDNVKIVHWLTDYKSGAFYGSCIVEMTSSEAATQVLETTEKGCCKVDNKKIKVSQVFVRDNDIWPPHDHDEREYPPLGKFQLFDSCIGWWRG